MITCIEGVWSVASSSELDFVQHHVYSPISPEYLFAQPSQYVLYRRGEHGFVGQWYHPGIPTRSHPHWPYDGTFECQLLDSPAAACPHVLVNTIYRYRAAAESEAADAVDVNIGRLEDSGAHGSRIMWGIGHSVSGNASAWLLRYDEIATRAAGLPVVR